MFEELRTCNPVRSYSADDLNDIGNARHFAQRSRAGLRYCHAWKKWLIWDGTRWKLDDAGAPVQMAKHLVAEVFDYALRVEDRTIIDHARRSASRQKIFAMIDLAASEPGIPIAVESLDPNPWLLNCPNGTVDLRTGELGPHRRENSITKLCPTRFNLEAESSTWDMFIESVFPDAELAEFVQRLFGYFLTGLVLEQILAIFWGVGSNGKSTLLNAFLQTIGSDYTMQAMPDFLIEKRGEPHPTEKADLFGKRFVSSVETEASRKLAESTVKMLTGGERIRARRMREDFWEFAPTHKIVLCTNHKPIIKGTDHAIWRRLMLIPFAERFEGERKDKTLPEKLHAEAEGILAWAVRGCRDWHAGGLRPPKAVLAATQDYRSSEDIIGRFICERCATGPNLNEKFSDLYMKFEQWCEDTGEFCHKRKKVTSWLRDNGYEDFTANGLFFRGLSLAERVE